MLECYFSLIPTNFFSIKLFLKYSSVALVSVTNSFSDTPQQFNCNNMKMGLDAKFYAVIVCRVYKGSVRFITIATAFKKSREKGSPINKQEHFDRGN